MGSLASIRTGLKTRLATITGINAYDVAPGTPNLPAAMVLPGSIEFDESMGRGSDLLTFEVRLLVAESTMELSQTQLDAYLAGSGASSVKAAIEGDATLAGAADWTRVTRVVSYGQIEHNGVTYLGARFAVEVDTDGS